MRLFFVIFVTVACAALSYFLESLAVRDLLRQHFAESFPHVQGTVVSSQLTKTYGSKGAVHYHPQIMYRYTADGVQHTGYRYRYDGHPTDYPTAYEIVSGHPPGSSVDVYYNPADTTEALLSPGADRPDMVMVFFMAITITFLWLLPSRTAQQPGLPWTGPEKTGGARVITEMMVTRLRMPRFPPSAVAVVATGSLMLLATAVIAMGLLSTPLWETGEWAFAIVITGGMAVYVWQFLDVHSGKRDLVIDESAGTVQLPLTYGRREQAPISFSRIRSVFLNKIRHKTKNGVYYTYIVTLHITDSPEQKLINLNQARAQSLATWLREKLRVAAIAAEPDETAADT